MIEHDDGRGLSPLPGNHCGSTALRNLLAHAGVELTEEMAFGLGAGACFYYVKVDGQSPSRFTNGRVAQARGAVPRADRACRFASRHSTTPTPRGTRRASRSTRGTRRC